MKNQIVKIETTQLEKVVTESGLAIQEGEDIKKSYLPFLSQLSEIQSQATKINFDTPAEIDETIARELRLKTVKIRTASKDLKDERKRGYLLRGNLEQAAYNLIEASCKLTEDVFVNVEKAREIAEKKRKEQLMIDRTEKLSPYTESVVLYPLADMSEDEFNEIYSTLRIAHENKIELERKKEEERLAAIEAERIRNEQIRLENEKLKKEAEAKEKAMQAEREKARKDQEEKDRLAEIERKKQADLLKTQQDKADKERAELLAKNQANIEKADKERKEKEQLLANIEAEKQAKLKQIESEKKAKALEDKKAKLAPDKDKLLAFGQALNNIERPEIKLIEAAQIMATINGYLTKLDKYIVDEANKL